VLRCLEKNPAKRFASAGELQAALRSVAEPRASRVKTVAGLALLLAGLGSLFLYFRVPPGAVQDAASPRPGSVPASPRPEATSPGPEATSPGPEATAPRAATAARPEAEEQLFRKKLPLTFAAKHSHRIGSCSGSLLLEAWGIEYRSEEHDRLRLRFEEIRVMRREDARRLRVETREQGKDKSYNFSFTGRPPGDADWSRYRKLLKR
jgi:hypothetical protein